MTAKRKARVGDTIRHNGKNPAYGAGEEFVVTEVVDLGGTGGLGSYWVAYQTPDGGEGSAWESQFDIVESTPEFKKGDRVKLTPKDGGEGVIYGEFYQRWLNHYQVSVIDPNRPTPFHIYDWDIELVKPSTEEILNGLGENAYVAHRTDAAYSPYVKIGGQWRLLDDGYNEPDYEKNVAHYIDHEGFEIIFEGIKDA